MIASFSLPLLLVVTLVAGVVIVAAGVRMTDYADRLADQTGLGEAIAGGVLLGMATSLGGVVVSITAAAEGRADLAFSNAVGGIAAQTAFLAVADLSYRRANLERASAEQGHVFQAALLTLMLSLPMAGAMGPDLSILGVHPVSLMLPVIYVAGVRATQRLEERPAWRRVRMRGDREDTPDEPEASGAAILPTALRFAALAVVLGFAGYTIAKAGGALSDRLGVSESAVGALLTAVTTSLPELITTLAAVRRGALQLAVGGIVGGNIFDVLFLTLADASYAGDSLYQDVSGGPLFWLAVGLVMTALLLLGLLFRHEGGPKGIGFESASMLGVYAAAVGLQALMG
ncbi:MAG: sodium:calcium antiporter [Paracoccaceae bacterium]